MRYILLVAMFLSKNCEAISQKTFSVEINHDGTLFSVLMIDSSYKKGSIIFLEFQVKNLSRKKFLMFDLSKISAEPKVYADKKELYFTWGGHDFDPKPYVGIPKLIEVDVNQTVTKKIMINTKNLPISKDIADKFSLYFDVGYFEYSDDLIHLTRGENDIVTFNSEKDWGKLLISHRPIHLGDVPIFIDNR